MKINIPDASKQALRWMGKLGGKARDHLANHSEITEPDAGALWSKISPDLDKALAIYDRKESPSTPDSTWIPLRESKASCRRDLDKILDKLLEVLEMCGAAGYRERIRDLQENIKASKDSLGMYREQMLSAPSEASLNPVEAIWTGSREGLEDSIADANDRVAEKERQIEGLKAAFYRHLQELGVDVSPEEADSFLLPPQDGIVSIAAVIANIGRLTEQLQRLVDQSGENPSHTKKYYGVYVLLVLAVDRIQKQFVNEVDEDFIPRLGRYGEEAGRNIAKAQALISGGGSKELLLGNISAGMRTIEACRVFADMLRDQRRTIADRNRETQRTLGEAANTYKTVRLSLDVAELIGQCQAAFRALRELRLPPLRTFLNTQLNDEMQQLAERIVEKE